MKHAARSLAWAFVGLAVAVAAEAETAAPPSAFGAAIDAEIASQEEQFLAAAEAMPEGRFASSPESLEVAGSALKGVRTFGQQVKHVAADNFAIWAPLAGKPEPAGLNAPNGPAAMTSRAEILKFLKDSFVYSREAAATLTPENALELVDFRGSRVTRISLVALAMTHMSNHYGQMAVYLRLFGVVPPASRPRQMAARSGPAVP